MNNIYDSGYIKVSNEDELYFEAMGNKNGFPMIFIHGGPGDGFEEENKKIFDFEKNNVIFFEQRRCSKSKFFGNDILKNHTTQDLVNDLLKVIKYFGFEKVNLLGHSWGTALSLIFAIQYPEKINNIILSGVYLPEKKYENDFLMGNGNEKYFPDFWEDFIQKFPENIRDSKQKIINFISSEIKKENYIPLLEWFRYEGNFTFDGFLEKQNDKLDMSQKNINSALIEFYFMINGCFIPENYILENIEKLDNINFFIIQGRYDSVCPCSDAWKLHKNLKNSKISFVLSGHTLDNKNIQIGLNKAIKKL